MTEKIMYWASVVFSVVALLLFVANTSLINKNRELQAVANDRQARINSASSLTQLNQNLAQALAELSVKNDDKDIRKLLESQGITVTNPADKAKGAAPAAKKTTDMKEKPEAE